MFREFNALLVMHEEYPFLKHTLLSLSYINPIPLLRIIRRTAELRGLIHSVQHQTPELWLPLFPPELHHGPGEHGSSRKDFQGMRAMPSAQDQM